MSNNTEEDDTRQKCSVHAQMDLAQLRQLDELRVVLQRDVTGHKSISRSDVLRLALWRLYLAYLTHLSELPGPPADLLEQWTATAAAIRADGACPDWLVPGPSLCLLHGQQTTKAREPKASKKGE